MAEQHDQKVEYILVKDLVLWTENPRDPISSKNKNVGIIKRAIEDVGKKWQLRKLAKEMGTRYDCSELPTVVYTNGFPVVYDDNRRVIVAMLKLGLYPEFNGYNFKMPECPSELPCNVTSRQIALESVWRKHADTGSWDPIARDIFRHKFWKEDKSVFLQLNEILGGVISSTPYLNQRFVGEEILTNPRLKDIGVKVENGTIISRHNAEDTKKILDGVFRLIEEKKLNTRNDRTKPLSQIIAPELKTVVAADQQKDYQTVAVVSSGLPVQSVSGNNTVRLPRRVKSAQFPIFGEKLGLEMGEPANLYRDIVLLYEYYEKNKNVLSDKFPALIRMALRLQCELIAKCTNSKDMSKMVGDDFDKAKGMLSQEQKTFLANNSVTKSNIVGLLQTGAHNYQASFNIQQTIAMSFIVGGLLKLHCAKKGNER